MSTSSTHDQRIAKMTFASVFPMYLAKVEKKGRTKAELYQVIEWLTGFSEKKQHELIKAAVTFEAFFQQASLNPNAPLITGVICGYRIEEIANPLTRQVRYLDKLVDELAKGRKMEKILRDVGQAGKPGTKALLALVFLAVNAMTAVAAPLAPCRPTVVGRLETFRFASRVFKNERSLRVWLPPAYNPAVKYPVLFILDGASAFDACTAYRHEEMSADETLTTLIRAGRIPPVIAVGIDNGSDVPGRSNDDGVGRASEFLAYEDGLFPRPFVPRGADFPAFLSTDVMPAIATRYPVLTDPGHTAIWGASYGGAAALYTIVHRPGLFGAAIIESPSLQVGNGQLLRDTQFLVAAPSRVAIGVGSAEEAGIPDATAINALIVRSTRQLVANFKAAFSPTAVTLNITEGGHHDTPTFGRRFADALLFLYSGSK